MPDYQTFLDTLRHHGCRITPQREMIVDAIARVEHHVTAEEIYTTVQAISKALNLATVYRTLDLLVEVGLISRINLGNGRIMYTSDRHGPHLHLTCRQCGGSINADSSLLAPLSEQLFINYGFMADLQHLCLNGLCPSCHMHR